MFLVWTSDHSPFLNNSMCSRFPIAIIPASRYVSSDTGVITTLEVAAKHIVHSFNSLSTSGIKVRSMDAYGPRVDPLFQTKDFFITPEYDPRIFTEFPCFWLGTSNKIKRSLKVARLRFYVLGFRGDWKALKQLFSLNRHYSTNEANVVQTKFVKLLPKKMTFLVFGCVSYFVLNASVAPCSDMLALPCHERTA